MPAHAPCGRLYWQLWREGSGPFCPPWRDEHVAEEAVPVESVLPLFLRHLCCCCCCGGGCSASSGVPPVSSCCRGLRGLLPLLLLCGLCSCLGRLRSTEKLCWCGSVLTPGSGAVLRSILGRWYLRAPRAPAAKMRSHSLSLSSSLSPTRCATSFHVTSSPLAHPLCPNACWTAALNRLPRILWSPWPSWYGLCGFPPPLVPPAGSSSSSSAAGGMLLPLGCCSVAAWFGGLSCSGWWVMWSPAVPCSTRVGTVCDGSVV